ncbi:putrescine ABC transporter permease PotI, partial [Xanthomonas vasicola]
VMVLAVSVAAVIGWWLLARSEKRRLRDAQLALQREG